MNVLNDKVLVLNRCWQAIDETDVQTAICDVFRGVACAIFTDDKPFSSMTWEQWLQVPIRDNDRTLRTVHGLVRVPTVIGKFSYAKMPKRAIKFGNRGVKQRDRGICQLTGELAPDGNVEHWMPRDLGGENTWENTYWVKRELNDLKKNMHPDEFVRKHGYKPLKKLKRPEPVPACALIPIRKPDWAHFIGN